MKEVKTGLVLEGGAMRGMYTAGILDVLMEEKIQVDGEMCIRDSLCSDEADFIAK